MKVRPKGLKPQRKLLTVAIIIFLAWIGLLIWMYVSWVWPTRRDDAAGAYPQNAIRQNAIPRNRPK